MTVKISTLTPVIEHPTFRDVGHSTVNGKNFDLTSESHVNGNQLLAEPTETTPNTENTSDTPFTSEVNDVQQDYNTRVGNSNL